MRRLIPLLAFALALLATPAGAQNICPTAPTGTSNNQCASTAFVQTAIPSTGLIVGTTTVNGGTTARVLYDNNGILGEYPITGSGSAVLGTSPTIASPTFTGTVAGANTIPLSVLAQSAANTIPGNWTGSPANVVANAMPSCADTAGNHLNYVNGTGITCGTGLGSAITALTGDVTATGPGSVAATLATSQPGAHTWALGQTFSSAMSYGGVTLSNAVTGTGNMVLATAPSVSSLTVTSAFTATGLVTNADLANAATTVNGQTCTLGASCTVTAVPSGSAGGDLTGSYPNPTLAAKVTAGGPTGSATVAPIITYNAAGQLTTVSSATITPAVGSITGLGTGVATALAVNVSSAGAFARLIASGAKALATGAIGSGACTSAQTDTATGALTSDAPSFTFASDPTGVTGYIPSTSGMLAIIPYVTADTINFKVCNNTSASITPGAISINWRVTR